MKISEYPDEMQPDGFISITEAAKHLSVSPSTLRAAIRAGRLPAFRFGPRLVRIRRSDLNAYLGEYR